MIDIQTVHSLKRWTEANPSLANIVSFTEISTEKGSTILDRISNHRKYLGKLETLLQFVAQEKERACQNIGDPTAQTLIQGKSINFDIQSQNLLFKKSVYVSKLIQEQKLRLTNNQIDYFTHCIEEIKALDELLTNPDTIPPNLICKINETFFYFSIPTENASLQFQIIALEKYLERLEATISSIAKPEWTVDFKEFFNNILENNVHKLDDSLSYIAPCNDEERLAMCIFGGYQPKIMEHIDYICDQVTQMPPEEFVKFLLDECIKLVPDNDSRTDNEQTVALMIYYRIVYNRLYEKYSDIFFCSNLEDEDKVMKIADIPACLFPMPDEFKPDVIGIASMRDVFQNDAVYYAAAQFLNCMIFDTNPIDILYNIHKSLLAINKAALIRRLNGHIVTSVDDIQQILCFDDLFILFFGVMCASDIPELFAISNFISKHTPAFCLTNSFEYAQAGIEALIIHMSELSIPEFIEQAKELREKNIKNQ